MRLCLIPGLILLVLTGCALPVGTLSRSQAGDPAMVASSSTVTFDEHRMTNLYKSASIEDGAVFKTDSYFILYQQGTNEPSARRDFMQIHFRISSREWMYYRTAYHRGRAINLSVIDRRLVSCFSSGKDQCSKRDIQSCGMPSPLCEIREEVALSLSHKELLDYSNSGLSLQLAGDGGYRNFNIPAGFFAGFREFLKQHETAASR